MKLSRNIAGEQQSGYSLIEIIVSLAIAGFLGIGITIFTSQMIDVVNGNNNRMHAMMQVENAGYWLSRDVQMSENLTLGDNAGFPLQLDWKDIDQNEYQITYTLTGDFINRSLIKNEDSPIYTRIAQDVNPAASLTNLSYTDGILVFNVTSTSRNIDVSRTYQIKQRLDLQ